MLTKKIEVLRALVRTVDQFEYEFGDEGVPDVSKETPFLDDVRYNPIDLKMVQEFKKVNSLGFNQLEKFVNELNTYAQRVGEPENRYLRGKAEGPGTLDPYTVIYFVTQLKNGPYGKAKEFLEQTKDLEIFKPAPDIMGVNTESNLNNSSFPIFEIISYKDGLGRTTNKAPSFMNELKFKITANTDTIFASNVTSAVVRDNTLPFIDKENTLRIEQEPLFGRSKLNPAHGNHMVKDIEKKELFKQAISPITEELIEFLGEKGYNIYLFNELINYFNPDLNLAISIGNEEKRSFNYMGQRFEGEGQDQQEIQTFDKTDVQVDMFGQPFDSVERREFKLNTSNNNGSNSFELYTIKGQLGSGIDVEPEPMEGCSED